MIDTSANRNTLINCGGVVQYSGRSKGDSLQKVIGKYTICPDNDLIEHA